MKPTNLTEIQTAFSAQAAAFDSGQYHLARQDYLNYIVGKTAPSKADNILEVAAGTCICARALAPFAGHIICLDATPAMLAAGKLESEKAGITNLTQLKGYAEELPFLNDSFDIVISRLAFHHFTKPKEIFHEMVRVLKPGGKLVLIDMVPEKDYLRDEMDKLERLRDVSHVRNLTKAEISRLFSGEGIRIMFQDVTEIPVSLDYWIKLTNTNPEAEKQIRYRMEKDIGGGSKTGFCPYWLENTIFFNQHWAYTLGIK